MHRRRAAADRDEPAHAAARGAVPPPTAAVVLDSVGHEAAEHSRTRTLCVGVDDFGLHQGVNHAALHLAEIGRANAIGCMVGGPAWQVGQGPLRRLPDGQVDVGLHLDLTEFPIPPQSRRSLAGLVAASFLRRLDRRAVRTEIRAQLDAFEQGLGRGPAFIDGHQHVHQLPVVRDELLAELQSRYGQARPWLRSTRGADVGWPPRQQGWRETAKAAVIEALGARGLASLARQRGFAQNRHLLGVYDFHGGPDHYRALLAAWLRSAATADLLMCHPSLPASADPLIDARMAEFEVLAGAGFGALLHAEGIALSPMSRILESGQ
jgi:chitin disaccharide deacetylase